MSVMCENVLCGERTCNEPKTQTEALSERTGCNRVSQRKCDLDLFQTF